MFVDVGFLCVFVSFVVPFTSSELNTGRGIPGRALRMSTGEARNCSYETADQIDIEIHKSIDESYEGVYALSAFSICSVFRIIEALLRIAKYNDGVDAALHKSSA